VGPISGDGSLLKIGGSALTLSGNNTYSGGTTTTNGTLVVNSDSALGTGTLTVNPSTVRVTVNDGYTMTNAIVINGGNPGAGRGVIENSGSGTATLSDGTITINSVTSSGGHFASFGGGVLDVQSPIVSTTNVTFRAGNGIFSGVGSSYDGFFVTGTVKVGANDGLSTSAVVDVGWAGAGTLDLNGFNQTLTGVTRNNTGSTADIVNNAGTGNSRLTLTGTCAFSGAISDYNYDGARIALDINGGDVTLSGANTYSGPTTNRVGSRLQIGAGSASGELGLGNVVNDGTLVFNRSDVVTVSNAISGAGAVVKD
jgi:autotransporter-associated beta strand protein